MPVTSIKQFTGLPYKAGARGPEYYDCWGLVRYFYQEMFGIELPLHAGMYFSGDTNNLHEEIVKRSVACEFIEVSDRKFGDILLIRHMKHPVHAGVRVSDTHFIHSAQNIGSVKTEENRWRNKVEKYFRHKTLMD